MERAFIAHGTSGFFFNTHEWVRVTVDRYRRFPATSAPSNPAASFPPSRALMHSVCFVLCVSPSTADLKLTYVWPAARSHSRPENQPEGSSITPPFSENCRRFGYHRSNLCSASSVRNHKETKRETETSTLPHFHRTDLVLYKFLFFFESSLPS